MVGYLSILDARRARTKESNESARVERPESDPVFNALFNHYIRTAIEALGPSKDEHKKGYTD